MKNQINFMGNRGRAGLLSIVLVVASLGIIMTKGIEKNVDFEGGSKLTVIFTGKVATSAVRDAVTAYEDSAGIVEIKTKDTTITEFGIKIKNPHTDERESDISPERRQSLEEAFANTVDENKISVDLLKSTSEEALAEKLFQEDILSVTGTDAVKKQSYDALASKVKAAVESADTLHHVADAVDPANASALARGLAQAYPAINRTTPDQLNALLRKYDPLGRDGADYKDIVDQIIAARTAQHDFFNDFSFLDNIALGDGENATALSDFMQQNFILGAYRIVGIQNFSASIAAELLANAWKAVILALVGILIYLWMRFSLAFGVASVVALAHDVIIALGVFSLFGAELSNPVVAAFLTIVGYSLNDTIVVFDRIRDNMHQKTKTALDIVFNDSINQTLSRTLVTSLTTLFVVIIINMFSGNDVLENFSFPLLVGIIVGTYSSIFVASPVLLLWNDKYQAVKA